MLIDTSALIELIRRRRFAQGAISVITLIEVLRGLPREKRGVVKRLLEQYLEVISIDNEVIEKYCELYDELRRHGTLIPDADILIAATAMSRGLKLLTKDKHFLRLRDHGLDVELMQS